MYITPTLVLKTLALLALCLSVTSRPVQTCTDLETCPNTGWLSAREAIAQPVPPPKRPPPVPPKPLHLQPEVPPPPFVPPPSFGEYTAAGHNVQDGYNRRTTATPDVDSDYASKITAYTGYNTPKDTAPDIDDLVPSIYAPDQKLGLGQTFGLDFGGKTWKTYSITAGNPQPVVLSCYSKSQRTIVVKELYNKRYGGTFDMSKKLPYSELIFQSWQRESMAATTGVGDLKYIVYADIDPTEFRTVIDDARKLLNPNAVKEGGIVSFSPTSEKTAEREAFTALVGMDNIKNGFYLATDHKRALGEKKPIMVHTFSMGDTSGSARHLVLEFA